MINGKQKERRKRRRNMLLAGLGGTAVIGTGVAIANRKKKGTVVNNSTKSSTKSSTSTNQQISKTTTKNQGKVQQAPRTPGLNEIIDAQNASKKAKNRLKNSVRTTKKLKSLSGTKGDRNYLDPKQINRKAYNKSDRAKKAIDKEELIRRAGGRRNSKITPEYGRQRYVLPDNKYRKSHSISTRQGDGLRRLSLAQENKLVNQYGYDLTKKRFRKGVSKSSKRKGVKLLKSLGRFSRFKARNHNKIILFCR